LQHSIPSFSTTSETLLIKMAIDASPNGETKEHLNTQIAKQLSPESYQYFLSDAAKERKPSPSAALCDQLRALIDNDFSVRGLFPLENKPGVISLLAGKPNDAMFPFESFSFTVTDPSSSSQSIPVSLIGADLTAGLQYGATAGLPRLNEWFVGLQERSHGRKSSEGWRLTIGNGSQDMISKVSGISLEQNVLC
jgi:tryptophan aminotransferase